MMETAGRIEEIETLLHRIERKYANDPLFGEVCAVAVLCLLERSGNGGGVFPDLDTALDACGVGGLAREAMAEALGGHWEEYRALAGRFAEDDLVDLFETRYVRTMREKVQSSPSLDALSLELLAIRAGESCLDLCAGAGFFVNEAWLSMSRLAGRGEDACLAGIEPNQDLARQAAVLSAIRGTGGTIEVADCFDPRHLRARYDKVHCTAPFGLNVRRLDFANVRKCIAQAFPGFPPITLTSADWLFAARAVAALKEGGKAVVVMPRAALGSAQSAPYRRHFVSQRWIESVIAFPEGACPGTSVPVAVVTFSKDSPRIKLLDLREYDHAPNDPSVFNPAPIVRDLALLFHYGNVVTKTPQEILARDGELDPAFHLGGPPSYGSHTPLGDLCETIARGAVLPKSVLGKLLPASGGEGRIPYLSPKSISDGLVDDDLPMLRGMPPGAESAVANRGDVVLTRSGPAFKVAVVERGPCVADGNLVVCRPGAGNPWVLAAFLASPEGAQWLRRMSSGLQHTLSLKKLARIPVPDVSGEAGARMAAAMSRRLARVRELRRELKENLSGIGRVFSEAMDNGGTGDGH